MKKYFLAFFQIAFIIGLGFFLLYVDDGIQEVEEKRTGTNKKSDKTFEETNAELTKSDQDMVMPGYTLYPISGPEIINLLDVDGKIVHQWSGIDADRARLLPNCNVLVLHGSKLNLKKKPWSELLNRASEYDWEGNLVWSYTSDYHIHHDLIRRPNGNNLFLLKVPVPKEFKALINDPFRRKFEIIADVIIETDSKGKTIWQWNSWDHLDLNDCGKSSCLGFKDKPLDRRQKKDIADWTHINTLSLVPENKWFDAGDYRFRPGNLIVLARNFSEIMIIDRTTGKVVWRYNGDYKGGMIRGHEANMISKGYLGAGNIIVLDNGFDGVREESYILEVNPKLKKVEWVYDDGENFYTRSRGSVQRLSNGNTLISEDRNARVFEVTEDKDIVWEYIGGSKLIVRSKKYPIDYCPQFSNL